MKIIIIIFFIVLILSPIELLFSQSNLFDFEKIVLIDKDNIQKYKIRTYYNNKCLSYILNDTYIKNDSAFFNVYLTSDTHFVKSFSIPKQISSKRIFINDFLITDSLAIFLDLMNILIYDFKTCKLINTIKLENTYLYISLFDDKIFCYNDISSSGNLNLNSRLYSSIYSFDGEQLKKTLFDEVKGIDFTYLQPRRIMDLSKTSLIIANVSEYKIDIYDHDFRLIDSLKRDISNWKKNDNFLKNDSIVNRNSPKADLQKCMQIKDSQSMIERIYSIDSNKLFVSWSSPSDDGETRDFFIDIWRNNFGKWILEKSDICDKKPKVEVKFDLNLLNLGYKYYNLKNEFMITIEDIPFELESKDFDLKLSEFNNKVNSFLSTNKMRYSILVRKFK